ncbi:MAG: tetratricopeptide repeat protein [Syntrophobacteraceae bacterium]
MFRKFLPLVLAVFGMELVFLPRIEAVPTHGYSSASQQEKKEALQEASEDELSGNYEAALAEYRRALAESTSPKERAKHLSRIGGIYMGLSQYDTALEHLNQALEIQVKINDSVGEGATLSRIGAIYQMSGRYDKALEYLQKALLILEKAEVLGEQGYTLFRIGVVYSELGRYEKALDYLKQALAIAGKKGKTKIEALSMKEIGSVYTRISQYKEALDFLENALVLARKIRAVEIEGRILTATGGVYYNRNQYREALVYCQQALEIHEKIHARRSQSRSLLLIGNINRKLANYDKAHEYFQQALSIQREIKSRGDEAEALTNIGFLYIDMSDFKKAVEVFEQALKISYETKTLGLQWRIQYGLANAKAKSGDFSGAVAFFDQALDTLEDLRSGFSDRSEQMTFMSSKIFVYKQFIKVLQMLHQKEPSGHYDRKALEIFERMQGRIMLEEVGKAGVRHFSGVPEKVRMDEEQLENLTLAVQTALSTECSKPANEQDLGSIKTLEDRMQQLRADGESLQKEIQKLYPDYYALKYPRPVKVTEIQENILRPEEAVLVYFVSEDSTCLWVISKEKFGLFTIKIGHKELAAKIDDIRKQIGKIKVSGVKESLAELRPYEARLCDLLLPKDARRMIAKNQVLYFVPTGPLFLLPFEILAVSGEAGAGGSRYLVEDYSCAYISSISLLKVIRGVEVKSKTKSHYPLLAFANPVYGKRGTERQKRGFSGADKNLSADAAPGVADFRETFYRDAAGGAFCELPETEEEVRKIASILSSPDSSEPLQLGEAASRSNVLRLNSEGKLDRYRYIVFACHGILPDETDEVHQPALVLSNPDPKTGREGFLTVADVYGLKVNADLVTLSACSTGMGRMQAGEGVIGLTRAFMYAGTPAVSVTLWSVESQSSKMLSTGHYENLNSGKTRARALRDIKVRMIRGQEGELYVHPYFWAPMVIFGEGQ